MVSARVYNSLLYVLADTIIFLYCKFLFKVKEAKHNLTILLIMVKTTCIEDVSLVKTKFENIKYKF